MLSVTVREFGGPEVLEFGEVPDPVPGPGQVLIDVAVADVLFLDTMLRSGAGRDYFPIRPPYVPGAGVAGTVRAVGFGADPALVGHQVAAYTRTSGGYAEQVVVDVGATVPVPHGRDLAAAAALLHDGTTALGLVTATGIGPDTSVLVVGASGGLGVSTVQLAVARGARVVATGRSAKLDRIRQLGVEAVDSGEPDWTTGIGPFDVVLDNVGGELGRAAFELVAPGGRFSAHGTPGGGFAFVDPAEAERRGITLHGIADVQFDPSEQCRLLAEALAEPALQPVIGQTFPLAKAADAHRAIAERTVFGKTLLTV
ncbi:zinc-binding dehydrogenase [Pseudonocardia sp. CA-107938]|uniref:zinc-binding dehydrogenase n=1 Tax=Pseudonocardia sp. CA-107938 TaxID=3240021 RepID=UPI003D91C8CB